MIQSNCDVLPRRFWQSFTSEAIQFISGKSPSLSETDRAVSAVARFVSFTNGVGAMLKAKQQIRASQSSISSLSALSFVSIGLAPCGIMTPCMRCAELPDRSPTHHSLNFLIWSIV